MTIRIKNIENLGACTLIKILIKNIFKWIHCKKYILLKKTGGGFLFLNKNPIFSKKLYLNTNFLLL